MRLIFGLVLLLGLGLAGFAALMAKDRIAAYQQALASERATRAATVPTTEVFVTTRGLRYGEALTRQDVRAVALPKDAVPAGAFLSEAALFPEGGAKPRKILRAMEPGEVVLAVKLTEPGQEAGVASRLSPGMRAFAIGVDVSSGVSGFLRPGDRVDVYWTGGLTSANGGRRDITKLIHPGLRLVAVDQSADEERAGATVARTVTVEATPIQVAALAQAQSTGSLSLSLVGAADTAMSEQVEIGQRELLGLVETKIAQAERPRICTIRTRRGSEVMDMPIPCSD